MDSVIPKVVFKLKVFLSVTTFDLKGVRGNNKMGY